MCVFVCVCVSSANWGTAAFHCEAPQNGRRERTPHSAADVSVYITWQNTHERTHTPTHVEANTQMRAQSDGGI